MSESHEVYRDLCAAQALGSIDERDRLLLEEHLRSGCESCEAALSEFSDATVLLAASASPARPSEGLRARVLDVVRSEPRTAPEKPTGRVVEWKPRPSRARWGWAWAAAAVVLALVAGLGWETASRLRARIQELEHRLAEERRWAAVSTAPGARVAVLQPTSAGSPALRGSVAYDPKTRRAIVILDNVRAPGGRDYQLWALRGTAPASLGLVHADPSGHAVLRLEDAGDPATLSAFAVSLEPQGGSPDPSKPSGPVVMLGTVGG